MFKPQLDCNFVLRAERGREEEGRERDIENLTGLPFSPPLCLSASLFSLRGATLPEVIGSVATEKLAPFNLPDDGQN